MAGEWVWNCPSGRDMPVIPRYVKCISSLWSPSPAQSLHLLSALDSQLCTLCQSSAFCSLPGTSCLISSSVFCFLTYQLLLLPWSAPCQTQRMTVPLVAIMPQAGYLWCRQSPAQILDAIPTFPQQMPLQPLLEMFNEEDSSSFTLHPRAAYPLALLLFQLRSRLTCESFSFKRPSYWGRPVFVPDSLYTLNREVCGHVSLISQHLSSVF